jgi:hypothetical protein
MSAANTRRVSQFLRRTRLGSFWLSRFRAPRGGVIFPPYGDEIELLGDHLYALFDLGNMNLYKKSNFTDMLISEVTLSEGF